MGQPHFAAGLDDSRIDSSKANRSQTSERFLITLELSFERAVDVGEFIDSFFKYLNDQNWSQFFAEGNIR